MNLIGIGILIAAVAVVAIAATPVERESRRRLRQYWTRRCMGRQWRSRFTDVPKKEIRRFLDTFVDGFGFKSQNRLKFSPDDRVMDIYRALYPSEGWPDAMELETFAINLEENYGIDLAKIEDHGITLGALFQMTRNPNHTPDGIRHPADGLPKPSV
jgi:propanediol dehydratase small subunit